MQVVTEIRLFRSPFTICYISKQNLMISSKEHSKSIGVKTDVKELKVGDFDKKVYTKETNKRAIKVNTNAFFLQPFVKECVNSNVYRENLTRNLKRICGDPEDGVIHLKLILEPPDKELIDYSWNLRMLQLIWTRVEIENAFSWLSTLGGAYSALGDYFEDYAEEAGRISIRQYKLSKMLGDDSLAARSKLYSALAYAQKGNLKLARHIIRNVAEFARISQDKRLNKMCQGVWVKLRYMKQIQSDKARITSEC